MDFVSAILDVVTRLWNCTAKRGAYMCHLEDNLNSLRDAKNELQNVNEDIKKQVELAEEQNFGPTKLVEDWLKRVEVAMREVDCILQRGEREISKKCCCGGYCTKNCYSTYQLGKEVIDKTNSVKELISKGHFSVVTTKLPQPPAYETPMEKTVGMDSMLSEVWRYIEDDSVKIVSLYGVGGVGKTTLLNKLNNKFARRELVFDVVIWVVVSKSVNIEKIIQEDIRNRLDIPDDAWEKKDEHGRAAEIFRSLRNKKFALLLDDLWVPIDFSKVGVSIDDIQNGSKIIFTTRFENVSRSMRADRAFNVQCLPPEEALNLFLLTVTEGVLNSHHEIPELAEIVAKECKGLPLALKTIGSTMAGMKKPGQWRHAIRVLQSYPSEFPGIGDLVFPRLKFSYDSLSSSTLKNCFLYCSIFPEDQNIRQDELIELWIGEGLLHDCCNIDDARDEGENIIESLKLACLLEEAEFCKDSVKMHDMLRDMALWLAREEANENLVLENDRLIKEQGTANWKEAVRISLWGWNIKFLTGTPCCPRLLTFLVRNTNIEIFPSTFFQSTHALKVLDLMKNRYLTALPVGMGELTNVRYLNLSYTGISELPIEIKSWTQLRILLLDGTKNLKAIPAGLISSLPSLQVFSWVPTTNELSYESTFDVSVLLQELESLEDIKEISVLLFTRKSVLKLGSSSKLRSSLKRLIIKCPELLSVDSSSSNMTRILGQYPGSFLNLHDLCIMNSPVKDLTNIIYARRLRYVFAKDCPFLEEIIASDIKEDDVFLNLRQLNLFHLPRLRSICSRAMSFPSLEIIHAKHCTSLKKLPLNSDSAKKKSFLIIGDKDWWSQLEWEDEAIKDAFSSKFAPFAYHEPGYTYEATSFAADNELRLRKLLIQEKIRIAKYVQQSAIDFLNEMHLKE